MLLPGDVVCSAKGRRTAEGGVFVGGEIRATVCGFPEVRETTAAVRSPLRLRAPRTGDLVVCQVRSVGAGAAQVNVLSVGLHLLQTDRVRARFPGTIRSQDVAANSSNNTQYRPTRVFRPGMVVLARVLTTGSPLLLSTSEEGLGPIPEEALGRLREE